MIRQLEPDNYTDLTLDTMQSDFFTELWDGERVSISTISVSLVSVIFYPAAFLHL